MRRRFCGTITVAWLLAVLAVRDTQAASFTNDFSDNQAGHWVSVNGNWIATNQQFEVTSGSEKTSSVYYDAPYSDFVFEARMVKTAGSSTDNLGFFFNGDPSQTDASGNWLNGYKVFFGIGEWQLSKFVAGSRSTLQGWTPGFTLNNGLGRWNKLRVSYAVDTIQVYINDILQGTFTDTTFRSGKLGLTLFDDSQAGVGAFDDVAVIDNGMVFNWTRRDAVAWLGADSPVLTIERHETNTGPVTVECFTRDGTAAAGIDYEPVTAILTFPIGVATQTVTIPWAKSAAFAGVKSYTVGLRNPTGDFVIGRIATQTVTLLGTPNPAATPILFTSNRNGRNQIFTMNPDGTEAHQITFGNTDSSQGRWAPDGRSVYFIRNQQVWAVDWDGRNERYVTEGQTLAVSPNGRQLAVSRFNGFGPAQDLFLYDLTTGQSRLLADSIGDDLQPDFSPDGSTVAYVNYGSFEDVYFSNIRTVNMSGGPYQDITQYDENYVGFPDAPRWSPDGTTLLFLNHDLGQNPLLQTIRIDGTAFADYWGSSQGAMSAPVWGPDGYSVLATLNGRILKSNYPSAAVMFLTEETSANYATDWLPRSILQSTNRLGQLSVSRAVDHVLRFDLSGPAGTNFVILTSTNLTTWIPWVTNGVPESGVLTVEDDSYQAYPLRFYRTVTP